MQSRLMELRKAHSMLLEEYLHAVDYLSHQSFFVNLDQENLAQDQRTFQELSGIQKLKWIDKWIDNKFHRMFPVSARLKPLARIFIEAHIRSRLRELSAIYIQQNILLKSQGKRDRIQKWTEQVAKETSELEGTLQTWNTIWSAILSIAGVFSAALVALLGVENLFDLMPKIISYFKDVNDENLMGALLIFTIVMVSGWLVVHVISSSYRVKKIIFIFEQKGDKNIYEREDDLFLLLNRGKSKDYPFSTVLISIWSVLSFGIFYYWVHWIAIGRNIESAERFVLSGWIIFILLSIYLNIVAASRPERW